LPELDETCVKAVSSTDARIATTISTIPTTLGEDELEFFCSLKAMHDWSIWFVVAVWWQLLFSIAYVPLKKGASHVEYYIF